MTNLPLASAWVTLTPRGADRFSAAEKALLSTEILVTYARARWLMARCDLATTVARLRATPAARTVPPDRANQAAIRLGRAVVRTLSTVPMDAKCLVRSLVLTTVLSRRGIDCTLVIGVRSEDGFAAHAWVERGGRSLLPHEGFARLHTL